MAHCFVFGGIGLLLRIRLRLEIGAVEGRVAHAQQARQCIKVSMVEITDSAVVRLLITGHHAEGGILPTGLLDPPGGGDADAVGVDKQHHQPLRGDVVYIRGLLVLTSRGSLAS